MAHFALRLAEPGLEGARGRVDASLMAPQIFLDSAIREWVLVPVFVAMFLFGVLRAQVSKLVTSSIKTETAKIRETQVVRRAQALRVNHGYIPGAAFRSKRVFFTAKEGGVLNEAVAAGPSSPFNPGGKAADPSVMVEMMKKNMTMMVPQFVTYNFISFFFSGFVVAKVPFALTMRFRQMLQRGVDLQGLDVTYISSLSWYFLNMIGQRGLFQLVLGENTVDDYANMQAQMTMGMQGDVGKAFTTERENLDLVDHEWYMPNVEQGCITTLKRRNLERSG